jgi:hypothetical protein
MPLYLETALDQKSTWRPWISTFRGQQHRMFTDDEERSIDNYIMQNFRVLEVLFTDAISREIATIAYSEKFQDCPMPRPFNYSAGFNASFTEHMITKLPTGQHY